MDDKPGSLEVPQELQTEIEAIILSGNTVAAIKHLRAALGLQLSEAASWVNDWLASNHEQFDQARRKRNKAAANQPKSDGGPAP